MSASRCWAVALGAIALSACGSSGPGALAPADRARLHAEVTVVRRDAQAGQAAAARAALGALRDELGALQRAGRLNDADAGRLRAAADQAQAVLPPPASARTTAPATTSVTPATPSTPSAPPAKAHGKGHGHGKHDQTQGDGGD